MSRIEFKKFKQSWEQAVKKGNCLYQKHNYSQAAEYYSTALIYSKMMMRSYKEAERYNVKIASPFLVSCLNLANTLWNMNDLKKAADYFFFCVWDLKMLSRKEGISELLRVEATKNWEKAVLALTDFYNKINKEPSFDFWQEDVYDKIETAKKRLDKTKLIRLN